MQRAVGPSWGRVIAFQDGQFRRRPSTPRIFKNNINLLICQSWTLANQQVYVIFKNSRMNPTEACFLSAQKPEPARVRTQWISEELYQSISLPDAGAVSWANAGVCYWIESCDDTAKPSYCSFILFVTHVKLISSGYHTFNDVRYFGMGCNKSWVI